jgi:hypothetical protein
MEKGIIEVFEAGSTLAINGGGTGVVEKAIIGANSTVNYQLICYVPERHQLMVSDFEVSPVEGKVKKRQIGFATAIEPEQKEVTILVDEDEKLIHIDAPSEVLIGMGTLNEEQVAEYRAIQEAENGEAEEKEEEGEEKAD